MNANEMFKIFVNGYSEVNHLKIPEVIEAKRRRNANNYQMWTLYKYFWSAVEANSL